MNIIHTLRGAGVSASTSFVRYAAVAAIGALPALASAQSEAPAAGFTPTANVVAQPADTTRPATRDARQSVAASAKAEARNREIVRSYRPF
jgi:hypothetical protein